MGAFSVSDILEGVLLQYGFAIGTAVQGGDGVVGDVCVCWQGRGMMPRSLHGLVSIRPSMGILKRERE